MVIDIKGYKVFIASPSGLDNERRTFRRTLTQYSEDDSTARGVSFIPVGWEDTLGGAGRPQEIINDDVRMSDFFVLVLWDRWGSPPSRTEGAYSSGTEEELHVAMECLRDQARPMRKIVVLFKGVDERQLSDPGDQLQKVLDFKRKIERDKSFLYKTFDTAGELERILRKHLASWVRDDELDREKTIGSVPDLSAPAERAEIVPVGEGRNVEQLLELADSLARSGNFTDAEAAYSRAVVGSTSVDAVVKYGKFLRRRGRLEHASAMFYRARELAVASKDRGAEAWALANLGVVERNRHRYRDAEPIFKEALELAAGLKPEVPALMSYILGNMAQLYTAESNLEEAERIQMEALEHQRGAGNAVDLASSLGSLGVIYRKRGRWPEAEAIHREGIKVAESAGDEGFGPLAFNCGSLGLVLAHVGKTEEAIECHCRALEVNKRQEWSEGQALNHSHLASAYVAQGDLDKAMEHNRIGNEINAKRGNIEGVAYNSSVMGQALLQKKDFATAAEQFDEAVRLYEKLDKTRAVVYNLVYLAQAELGAGRLGRAVHYMSSALSKAPATGIHELIDHVTRANQELLRQIGDEDGSAS